MKKNPTIAIKRLDLDPNFPMPKYEQLGSVGADICSTSDFTLNPGQHCVVSVGFAIEVPRFYEAQVRTHGNTATKHKIIVSSITSGIDNDNTEEVKVWLQNIGSNTFRGLRGMKVAQIVINPIAIAKFITVEDFLNTEIGTTTKSIQEKDKDK